MVHSLTRPRAIAAGLSLSLTLVAGVSGAEVRRPTRVLMFQQPSVAVPLAVVQPAPVVVAQPVAVRTTLSANPQEQRAKWESYLTQRRAQFLVELGMYAQAGQFPINNVRRGRVNVMIDDQGSLCAVAHLMATSGARAMVDAASQRNNFMLFAQQTSGPIVEWILRSGFTSEEIARIQEPYSFQEPETPPQSPQARAEVIRLQTHFNTLVPQLATSTAASVQVAIARMGDRVLLENPPAI